MRTALDQALGAPSPAYAAGLAQGQPIKKDHIQELRNRVTAALSGQSSSTLSQYYDGAGLRVKKTENGATTWYLRSSVLGGQVVAEMNGSAAWQRGFVYAGSSLLAVQQGGVFWMHEDPVTKSKRVTNSAGTVVSWIETDPWGADTNRSSNAAFQPKKFTSYDRDANGSDEAMFRRFNRKHSRFDQPDPYDGSYDFTDPQSFNRYAYVQNDPVNFVDPSGLNLEEPDHRWSATDGMNPMGFMGPGIHLESNREGFIIQRWIVFGPLGQSPQNSNDDQAANVVANAVEAALQVLKNGCWSERQWNQDVKSSTRYFANIKNAANYTKDWSRSLSVHDTGVKESPTILTHSISVVDGNGTSNPAATALVNGAGAFNFVLKFYPGQGMAVTSNTFSLPHVISTPGYALGADPNVNVRWAQMFLNEAPKCPD